MTDSHAPRISVIIPTYNRPERLPRAVRSALVAARDCEVILVNDASPHLRTRPVCDHLADAMPQVRVLHLERNGGVAGARNAALHIARGEYVAFHDDDDARASGSYDRQADALDAQPQAAFCHGQAELCAPDGALLGKRHPLEPVVGEAFRAIAAWNPIQCITVLMRRAMVEDVGGLDASITNADDWDLWIRLSARYEVAAVPGVVAFYRETQAGSGQGSARLVEHLRLARQVQEKAFASPRGQRAGVAWQNQARATFDARACDWLLHHASEALHAGLQAEARSALREALRLNPRRWRSKRVPYLAARLLLTRPAATP